MYAICLYEQYRYCTMVYVYLPVIVVCKCGPLCLCHISSLFSS